jgi:hypothetical protein
MPRPVCAILITGARSGARGRFPDQRGAPRCFRVQDACRVTSRWTCCRPTCGTPTCSGSRGCGAAVNGSSCPADARSIGRCGSTSAVVGASWSASTSSSRPPRRARCWAPPGNINTGRNQLSAIFLDRCKLGTEVDAPGCYRESNSQVPGNGLAQRRNRVDARVGFIMLHKLLLSSVALVGLTGLAGAADLAFKAPPPVYVPTWTGCYLGGHAGYGMANSTSQYSAIEMAEAGLMASSMKVTTTRGSSAVVRPGVSTKPARSFGVLRATGHLSAIPPATITLAASQK